MDREADELEASKALDCTGKIMGLQKLGGDRSIADTLNEYNHQHRQHSGWFEDILIEDKLRVAM